MPRLEFAAEVEAPLETVWAFYASIDGLSKVTPPETTIRVLGSKPPMAEGGRYTLIVTQPPIYLPLRWETVITEYIAPVRFVDEQGRGPFAFWRHEHDFEPAPRGRTLVRDTLTYEPPLGPLGLLADALFLRRKLEDMFRYRHTQTRRLLEPGP